MTVRCFYCAVYKYFYYYYYYYYYFTRDLLAIAKFLIASTLSVWWIFAAASLQ